MLICFWPQGSVCRTTLIKSRVRALLPIKIPDRGFSLILLSSAPICSMWIGRRRRQRRLGNSRNMKSDYCVGTK